MISQTDLLEKSRAAGQLYAPTPFGEQGSARILDDLDRDGIENFRNRGAPLSFFVATYGYPGNSLSQEQIAVLQAVAEGFAPKQRAMVEAWRSGASHALSDYWTFAAAARAGLGKRLLQFSDSYAGNPIEQFHFDDKNYSWSALNCFMGLYFLAEHMDLDGIETVLEIGAGSAHWSRS
jgi:putative sugar O-methyltransferase